MSDAAAPAAPPSTEEQRIGALVTALIPLVDGILGPGTAVGELGQKVYGLVIDEIGSERVRCVEILRDVAKSAEASSRSAGALIEQARIRGDIEAIRTLEGIVARSRTLASALVGVSNMLLLPPGTCLKCGGEKLMPSRLNPNHRVPCDACAPPPPAPPAAPEVSP